LDVYQTIFVWCGHESTPNERSYAMLKAEELIEIGDRPRCCDISWAVDGAETIYFQEQFCDWTTAEWEDGTHAPHTYTTIS
jgi:advillin